LQKIDLSKSTRMNDGTIQSAAAAAAADALMMDALIR
jgi:hypothetical protein